MVDTIRLYNELLGKAVTESGIYQFGSSEALRGERGFKVAKEYALTMKTQHQRLKEEVSKLQQGLERFAAQRAHDEYAGS